MKDNQDNSSLLYKTACPSCGSSDANAVYSDGHSFCYSCNTHGKGEDTMEVVEKTPVSGLAPMGEAIHLSKRKIPEDIAKKFSYTTSTYNGPPVKNAK